MDEAVRVNKEPERPARGPMDMPFLCLVLMLTAIGLIMLFSASFVYAQRPQFNNSPTYFLTRQGVMAIAGVVIMITISFMDYQYFRALSLPVMIVAVIFLLLVPFIGTDLNTDAKRWIDLGMFSFQPSEIAKLGVIMTFSAMISVYRERMKTFKYGILPFALILLTISGLLFLQPHLSATVLILGVGGVLMLVGGAHWGWFTGAAAAGGVGIYVLITQMGYAARRIEIWRDPFVDPRHGGYQAIQSLYALGSGGLFGVGLGRSRQKYAYLPERHNDFIFAVIGEELGFVGACLIMSLFVLLILRGYWIAMRARDRFGSLLVTGVITLLALQVFFNIGVVSTFLPTTGISLPFFSYGGTALILQLAQMGVVLAVSRRIPAPKSG
ncbi:MAG: putative lipid II flippase FtsW [Oscillospiraceae bacterium]|nr:putative lipid II flippase FtsW [Oscillospiraceae bacterium]